MMSDVESSLLDYPDARRRLVEYVTILLEWSNAHDQEARRKARRGKRPRRSAE
jgi:hypothetical protein